MPETEINLLDLIKLKKEGGRVEKRRIQQVGRKDLPSEEMKQLQARGNGRVKTAVETAWVSTPGQTHTHTEFDERSCVQDKYISECQKPGKSQGFSAHSEQTVGKA